MCPLQFSLFAQSCLTLWDPMPVAHQASLSITKSRSLLKLMSIELVMPYNHLILCHPLLLPSVFPSIRVFSDESALPIKWPKCWSFSFSISPSSEHSAGITWVCVCVHVTVAQLRLVLCNPMDYSPPDSSVHGIILARILVWFAISSSKGSSRPRDQTSISYISCIGRQVLYH